MDTSQRLVVVSLVIAAAFLILSLTLFGEGIGLSLLFAVIVGAVSYGSMMKSAARRAERHRQTQ